MFCALFKCHLLLAASRSGKTAFEIVAIISLNDAQTDKADNGKGSLNPVILDDIRRLMYSRSPMSHSAFFVEDTV